MKYIGSDCPLVTFSGTENCSSTSAYLQVLAPNALLQEFRSLFLRHFGKKDLWLQNYRKQSKIDDCLEINFKIITTLKRLKVSYLYSINLKAKRSALGLIDAYQSRDYQQWSVNWGTWSLFLHFIPPLLNPKIWFMNRWCKQASRW